MQLTVKAKILMDSNLLHSPTCPPGRHAVEFNSILINRTRNKQFGRGVKAVYLE